MYLIVGAGLAGAVIAERIASQLNKEVLVIDRRNHIAGNIFDYVDENGIWVHKYGPHIFHTNSEDVWNYLNQFTDFEPYYHRVLAVVEGMKIPVPFNLNSLAMVFPETMANNMTEILLSEYGFGTKVPILKLLESGHPLMKELGDYVYHNVFLEYTKKQWGLKPTEIDRSVTSRVPVYISKDNRFFQDKYQGMPLLGYTTMVEKMLSHRNIKVELDTDFKDVDKDKRYEKIVFSGCIDEYHNYQFGELGYRSLSFEKRTMNLNTYQETSQVNYPNDYQFTRITEPKHFYREILEEAKKTTLLVEYPQAYDKSKNEAYYPIPNDLNNTIYQKYKEIGKSDKNTIFIGRLADYKYYNMDEVVGRTLMVFNKLINISE